MDKQICILVVEDDKHIQNIIEYNLRLDGFKVYVASDGGTGLELARKVRLDVILLDWILPDMDGLDVLSELKQNKRTKHIPVFMLTVKDEQEDVQRALQKGADWYFIKPLRDATELGQRIKGMLEPLMKNRKRHPLSLK